MIVMKFGGTSVGDAARIRALIGRIGERVDRSPVVVVSAMAGVTDALVAACASAAAGRTSEVESGLEWVTARHRDALHELVPSPARWARVAAEFDAIFRLVRERLDGIARLCEAPPRASDEVLAAGERLSAPLVAAALVEAGLPGIAVDPRTLIVTNDRHGAARPDEPAVARACESLRTRVRGGEIPVVGGFVGATADGRTTTLGRGGSDWSATLIGAALGAEEVEIWTDVDGVLTADPRVVPLARPLASLSFAEAAELAFFGAKVLHPETVRPAARAGIPVRILNSLNPGSPGTVVLEDDGAQGVRALAMRPGCSSLLIRNPRMGGGAGYAAEIFACFARHGAAVDVIATSEVSISVTVDRGAPLDALAAELSRLAEVSVERQLAVVCAVGRGLRATPGIAARCFGALGEINVALISQGASDSCITFVVAERHAAEAMRRLHAEFFPGSAAVSGAEDAA